MLNRKDLLKFIFISEKREDWKQYYGYWCDKIRASGLNYDSKLPFINIITYHAFECPVENYTIFNLGRKKVGFHIIYNISGSDIINCSTVVNNESDVGYSHYLDKISITTSGEDLGKLVDKNIGASQEKRFDYKREECKKNTELQMEKVALGLKSKITYDFHDYDYFDWKVIITNHIARFTTTSYPGRSGCSTKVEVLTTNPIDIATFYKVMHERERKKGVFTIERTLQGIIDLIKKVEVIGTDEEPYDSEYDNQINFDFKRRVK